ncbi:MAG TPA: hypothetical protein VHO90_15945 [Bacteroidales bacterium]|nr:hypothetical protein [Bacteroidales bacterium]
MNQKNSLNFIIDEIYQLESYIQGWRDAEDVRSIEKDLVLSKLQTIYDRVKHIGAAPESEKEIAPAEKAESIIEETSRTVTSEQEITIPGPVHEIVFENPPEAAIEHQPVIQEIPLKTEPVKQVVEVTVTKTQVETEKVKEVSKEILAEKLSHSHKFINETVKSRTVMDVSSKLKATPIPSIQSAINLNDKFVFIRELFKNNNLLYNQTIERLNNASNYGEALSIVEKEFGWDMNDTLVSKLVELIKRKHNA